MPANRRSRCWASLYSANVRRSLAAALCMSKSRRRRQSASISARSGSRPTESHRRPSPARRQPAGQVSARRHGGQQDGDQLPIVMTAIATLKMRSTRRPARRTRRPPAAAGRGGARSGRPAVPTATGGGPPSSSTRGEASRPSRSRPARLLGHADRSARRSRSAPRPVSSMPARLAPGLAGLPAIAGHRGPTRPSPDEPVILQQQDEPAADRFGPDLRAGRGEVAVVDGVVEQRAALRRSGPAALASIRDRRCALRKSSDRVQDTSGCRGPAHSPASRDSGRVSASRAGSTRTARARSGRASRATWQSWTILSSQYFPSCQSPTPSPVASKVVAEVVGEDAHDHEMRPEPPGERQQRVIVLLGRVAHHARVQDRDPRLELSACR